MSCSTASAIHPRSGWFVVEGFVSGGTFVLPLPRSARQFLSSLLIRAELAAHYLLRVSICLQRDGDVRSTPMPVAAPMAEDGDAPSVQTLVRRMQALRALLENLPHVARRMMRKPRSQRAPRVVSRPLLLLIERTALTAAPALSLPKGCAPRAERPPDPCNNVREILPPPGIPGGRRKRLVTPRVRRPNTGNPSSFRASGSAGTSARYSATSSPSACRVYD